MICKRCRNDIFLEHTQEVTDLEDENYIEVSGYICSECGCFHYSLGDYDIAQYLIDNKEETNACKSWMTDYQAKLIEHEN